MIKAPGWCSHAVPTLRGWKHPRTSEILKRRSISQAEIDEWRAAQDGAPAPQPEPVIEEVETDEPMDHNNDGVIDELESMTKDQLEELGREHGVELDRRRSKPKLVARLRSVISSK